MHLRTRPSVAIANRSYRGRIPREPTWVAQTRIVHDTARDSTSIDADMPKLLEVRGSAALDAAASARSATTGPAGAGAGAGGASLRGDGQRLLRNDRLRVQRVEPRARDAFFAEIQAARESGETPRALCLLCPQCMKTRAYGSRGGRPSRTGIGTGTGQSQDPMSLHWISRASSSS